MTQHTLALHGRLGPEDKARCDYAYVPFDVPDGIGRIDVRYGYDHARDAADLRGHGNTIDIGLFDPRGHEFGTARGFRGWSGSDRSTFFIAEDAATPGYLAGPVQAGRWHLIFGLYHIADGGCAWTAEVEMTPRDAARPTPACAAPADFRPCLSDRPGWYRGDLQCHTHHSDAKGSLTALVATARARGLDFLAVTDHNTISHILEFPAAQGAPDRPLLIPASEVTTYYGHMNVWGVRNWQEFRCSSADRAAMRAIIDLAHKGGGVCSVNHPKPDGPAWEYGDLQFDCVEAWQKPWPLRNAESLAFWDDLLMRGRRVVAVGGSDYHQPLQAMAPNPHLLGQPTTWVYAESLSAADILAGIRRGRVCISADVHGPRVELRAHDGGRRHVMGDALPASGGPLEAVVCDVTGGAGCELRLVADGVVARTETIGADAWSTAWHAVARPRRFLRAEVARPNPDPGGTSMLALANPLFATRGN